jgi:hypothetical protein
VEPADDLRASNPPTHPELLESMAAEFRKDYALPRLAALVMKSAAYARGPGKGGPFYESRAPRPLEGRVLAAAVAQALGLDAPPSSLAGEATLARTLALMNDPAVEAGLRAGTVEELYLRTLSRRPRTEERALWTGTDDAYRKDLMWALLNSREFGTNR